MKIFDLHGHGTTVGRECVAGVTTFAAMAYILAVNPLILENAGMDRGAAITATALAAALGSALMGLLTNYPIAQAPGMGLNAFFAFSICLGMGVPWQSALGLVFYSGVLFFILSVSGLRRRMIDAFPLSLKIGISAGIGMFIALLGLKNAGLVVSDPNTVVALGNLTQPGPLLALGGIILAAVLVARRVPGALLIGIGVVALAGLFIPAGEEGTLTPRPDGIVSTPASLAPVFLMLDLGYLWQNFAAAFPVVLALLFVDLFDSTGTLIGVAQRAGFLNERGELPRMNRALMADASASMTGALIGTSTTTAYIESAAGVEAGGRTGLTSLVVAACFLLALVFTPLLVAVPAIATGPALVIVGVFMMQGLRALALDDWLVAVPALVTLIMIPLTFSISDGIAIGFLVYVGLMVGVGKWRGVSITAWLLTVIFLAHFLWPM